MTATLRKRTVAALTEPCSVAPENLYPLSAIKEISGWKSAALREKRRKGLKVLYMGRTAFVLGSDFIDFVKAESRTSR